MTSSARKLTAVFAGLAVVASARAAWALDDCPPGSSARSEGSFTWCEPSVCVNDGQCRPDEVCRNVALCMQVGKTDTGGPSVAKDAGAQRLVATQRCGPDKTCPDTTVCSDMGRCLAKTTADKMGLLTPAASAAPASSADGAKASGGKCGCSTPGARDVGGGLALGLAVVALGVLGRRRTDRR